MTETPALIGWPSPFVKHHKFCKGHIKEPSQGDLWRRVTGPLPQTREKTQSTRSDFSNYLQKTLVDIFPSACLRPY